MQDRRMISEFSSKLTAERGFQFIGLSHDAEELENKSGHLSRADLVIIENCFNEKDMHEILRFLNGKAASVIGSRRIFKILGIRQGERIPSEFQLHDMDFDSAISASQSTMKIIHKLNAMIYANTCYVLDQWVSQIIHEGIDIPGFNEELNNLLHSLGISFSLNGALYLRTAIEIAFINLQSVTLGVTKLVYPTISIIYKTRPLKVERAMRHAIELGWQRGDAIMIEKIFSYSYSIDRGRPTNGEFIANVADYLILKYRRERKEFLAKHIDQVDKINAIIDLTTNDLPTNEKDYVDIALGIKKVKEPWR